MRSRIVEGREGVLKKNDLLARGLRARFREAGVTAVNLVSSPGSGKTALLERTMTELAGRLRVAALVGDLAEAVGFDREAAYRSLEGVRPGIEVIETSARSGEGMEAWLARLEALRSDRGVGLPGRERVAAPMPGA